MIELELEICTGGMEICLTKAAVEWKSCAVLPTCITLENATFIDWPSKKIERMNVRGMPDLGRDCIAAQVQIKVAGVAAVDPSSCSRFASKTFMTRLCHVRKHERVIMAEMQ